MRVIFAIMALMIICPAVFAGDSVSIEKITYDNTTSSVDISCVVNSSLIVGRDSLCVFQDGTLIRDVSISHAADRAQIVYLVFAFDCSKSISSGDFGKIKKAAKELASSVDNIQITILKFDDSVVRLLPFTGFDATLIRSIEDMTRSGKKTKLYEAIHEGIKLLETVDSTSREMIVFTDGRDEGSSVTADDVINLAKSARIPVYFWSVRNGKKTDAVKRIAALTGGNILSGERSGLSLAKIIKKQPRKEYVLSYKTGTQTAGFHTVEVQLVNKDILGKDISQYKSDMGKDTHPTMDRVLILVAVIGLMLLAAIGTILFLMRSRASHNQKDVFRQKSVKFEETLTQEDDREGVLHKGLCRAWLMQKDGPETGKKFPLYWEETVIGKDKSCALAVNDSRVSAKHVRIRYVRNAFYVIDLASDEGTFVNGKKLLRPRILNDWDEITIGQTMFVFRSINERV